MAGPLLLQAVIGETEKPAFASACAQLAESLGGGWSIQLQERDAVSSIEVSHQPALVVLSLVREAALPEPFAQTEARWRDIVARLAKDGGSQIFVCTVFRHVPKDENAIGGDGAAVVERIRRLNLMTAQLSHDFGINVIDIDRIFAFIGARALRTDFHLLGDAAAATAGNVIATALLEMGLDALIPPEVLDRARARHRNAEQIEKALGRRLG